MDLNLKDKVFFVAGSSRGIGLGIAKSYLAEDANVIITGRDKGKLQEACAELSLTYDSRKILPINADMQDLDNINEQLNLAKKTFGKIDGIIANIGSGSEPLGVPSDPKIWDISFDKNLKASMLLAQAGVPFLSADGGSIIFISSIAGIEDIKAPLAYSVCKSAIIAASKKLARSLAPLSIRVNAIAPGNIIFPGGNWERKKNENTEHINNFINSEVPLGCFGTPEDIGNVCVFLSSERANFITGSLIVVDGGQTRSF